MDGMLWHIGDVIRKKRERKGWTRHQLAHRAKVKPNTLGYLERDGSNYEAATLKKIVTALGTTEAAVFSEIPGVTSPVTPSVQTEDPIDARAMETFRTLPERPKGIIRQMIYELAANQSAATSDGAPSGNETIHAGRSASDLKRVK